TPAGSVIAGALLWSFHARAVATNHISDDRHSTLRALEGFIAVAFSIGAALFGATQILYYALDRALGVSNPGGAGSKPLAALGRGPAVAQPQALCLGRSSRQCAGGPWRRRRAHQRPASAGLQRASEPDR